MLNSVHGLVQANFASHLNFSVFLSAVILVDVVVRDHGIVLQ